jgi:hypothetical protein
MEMSGQLHAWPLYHQGKRPWYPLDRRLGDPHSQYGRGGEEKNSQPPRIRTPIIQPVAKRYTAKLSWLLFVYVNVLILTVQIRQKL